MRPDAGRGTCTLPLLAPPDNPEVTGAVAGTWAIAQGCLCWDSPKAAQLQSRPVLHHERPKKSCSGEQKSKGSPPESSCFQSLMGNDLYLPTRQSRFRYVAYMLLSLSFIFFSHFSLWNLPLATKRKLPLCNTANCKASALGLEKSHHPFTR